MVPLAEGGERAHLPDRSVQRDDYGDADHTIPWPDGPTCQANLGPVCRRNHRAGPSGRVRATYPTRYLID